LEFKDYFLAFVTLDNLFAVSLACFVTVVLQNCFLSSAQVSLKIVLNCAVARCGLVFGIGVGMLIVPVTRGCREQKKDIQVICLSISARV
jgi:hypothetical protein